MKKNLISVICSLACLLTLAACQTDLDGTQGLDQGGDFFNSEEGSAELIFHSPENHAENITARTPVTFMWDRPIFALQNPEKSQRFLEKNINITPPIEGSWQLLGTTGVLFEPSEDWKFSTRYSFEMADWGIHYSFETPRVEIESLQAKNLGGSNPLIVNLNQPIDLSEASKIRFEPNKDFEIAYGEVGYWENGELVEEIDTSVLEFTPKTEWNEQTNFTLTLPEGILGAEGDLPTGADQTQGFSTIAKFQVSKTEEPRDVFRSLQLEFSSQVNAHDFLQKIALEPIDTEVWEDYINDKLESFAEDDVRRYFYLDPPGGRWQGDQEYVLSVPADVEDEFGRQLGEETFVDFKSFFPNHLESFFFPYSHKVFRNGELPKFFVKHSGDVGPVQLRISKLWPRYKAAHADLNWEFSNVRQRIEELDLEQIFPDFFTDNDYAGLFKLELSYDEKNRHGSDTRSINFSIVDFVVEQKSAADGMVQTFVRPFPGDSVEIIPEKLQIITSSWGGRQGQLFNFGATQSYIPEFKASDDFWGVAVTAGDKIGIGSRIFQDGFFHGNLPVNIDQREYATDVRGVVFTDRPLFQPGDRVNFKSIFRETNFFQKEFPLQAADSQETFDYKVEIFDPRHETVYETKAQTMGGSLDGYWDIPDDIVFGEYMIEVSFPTYKDEDYYRDPNSARVSFYVGEYRKPDFLIDGIWDCERALWRDECDVTIQAEYAFGGALSGKPLDYTISLFGHKPRQWWWYAPDKQDRVIVAGSGVLDEGGEFTIPVDLDFELGDEGVDWDLVNLDITVKADPSDFSSKTVSIPFFVSAEQVELDRLPHFFGQSESKIGFSGTLENLSGEGLQKGLEAELIRNKWVRNDRKDAAGNYSAEWREVEEVIHTIGIASDARGRFSSSFLRPADSGEYIIRVTSYDSKKRPAVAEQSFYVWTSKRDEFTLRQNPENKTFLPFLEQDEYQVGETATVLFPHTEWEIDRAHVTLERGKVLETLTPDIANQTVSFPVASWMAPNVIVSIVLEGRDAEGSPKVKFGALNVPVSDPDHELDIAVQPEKTDYQPQDTVKLFLRTEKNGQPTSAELTIAVVDQTLLALRSRDQIGELFQKFLKELPLGVYTSHTLANFISKADLMDIYEQVEKVKAALDSAFGGGKGDDFKPRGEFRDTAEWIATIRTDQNGTAVAEFTLPDNLTTWHVWIVGHTDDNAFGEAESEFRTSLPLLIAPVTPNIFRFGDESEVGLLIRRNIDSPKSEKVNIKLTLPDEFAEQEYEKTVSVEDGLRVFFPVEVARDDKFAWPLDGKEVTLKFEIESEKSGLRDAVEIQRTIMPPTIATTAAEFFRIEEPESLAISTDERALESAVTFKVFGTLLDRLQKFIDEAHEMNYGCTEQRLSYWTGRILQGDLLKSVGRETASPTREELEENLEYILDSQDDTGGFHFWTTWRMYSTRPSTWLTANILDFAPSWQGVSFPEGALVQARSWLKAEIDSVCDPQQDWRCLSDATRQYSAFVLARDGEIAASDFDFLLKRTRSLESKAWFLRATGFFKKSQLSPAVKTAIGAFEEEFDRMVNARDRYIFWEEDVNFRSFYSQNERLTAILFQYWLENDIRSKLHPKIARYLADTKSQLSGNTALRVLMALSDYDEDVPTKHDQAAFVISSDDFEFSDTLQSPLDKEEETFSLKRDENYQFSIESPNEQNFYTDAELHEIFAAKDLAPISHGFWIQREMYELSDVEFENPIEELDVGKNYLVRLKIVSNSTHRQVVVEDPIVSGAEIVNFDFKNADRILEEFADSNSDSCYGWCRPLVSHRESRFGSARFFIDRLPPGTHEIDYVILARIEGTYEALPPKILEMYYPEVMATGEGREIIIER